MADIKKCLDQLDGDDRRRIKRIVIEFEPEEDQGEEGDEDEEEEEEDE